MASYSMNTGLPEPERNVVELNFENVAQYSRKASTTKPTVPYDKPAPVAGRSIETSNTIAIDLGPSAGDITRRGLNG